MLSKGPHLTEEVLRCKASNACYKKMICFWHTSGCSRPKERTFSRDFFVEKEAVFYEAARLVCLLHIARASVALRKNYNIMQQSDEGMA